MNFIRYYKMEIKKNLSSPDISQSKVQDNFIIGKIYKGIIDKNLGQNKYQVLVNNTKIILSIPEFKNNGDILLLKLIARQPQLKFEYSKDQNKIIQRNLIEVLKGFSNEFKMLEPGKFENILKSVINNEKLLKKVVESNSASENLENILLIHSENHLLIPVKNSEHQQTLIKIPQNTREKSFEILFILGQYYYTKIICTKYHNNYYIKCISNIEKYIQELEKQYDQRKFLNTFPKERVKVLFAYENKSFGS